MEYAPFSRVLPGDAMQPLGLLTSRCLWPGILLVLALIVGARGHETRVESPYGPTVDLDILRSATFPGAGELVLTEREARGAYPDAGQQRLRGSLDDDGARDEGDGPLSFSRLVYAAQKLSTHPYHAPASGRGPPVV